MIGIAIYSAFPVGPNLYYFLIGFSYANLDFIPNLFIWFFTPDTQVSFASYFLVTSDMNFLTLNGSILLFSILWFLFCLICRFLL